jgi:lactoylglutathione lyase
MESIRSSDCSDGGCTVITNLAHVAFAAHDLKVTLDFYAKLGLHEAFRLNHDDGSLMLVYLHVGRDCFIEVFPGGPVPNPARRGSFMHLCLAVDDLLANVERLRAAGVPILAEPTTGRDHNLQAWIRDPDGNQIELMQMAETSPQYRIARGEMSL